MLLHGRNRATDAFQLVIGIFLCSNGASRRVIDTFNHMGLSVSYQCVYNACINIGVEQFIEGSIAQCNGVW